MSEFEAQQNSQLINLKPQFKSKKDFENASIVSDSNSLAMGTVSIIGLILYLIFKNLSMDLLWTTFSMVQLLSNVVNLEVRVPANLQLNLDTL